MDVMMVAAFVAFFAMVLAWMVAPAAAKPVSVPMTESAKIVAAESLA